MFSVSTRTPGLKAAATGHLPPARALEAQMTDR